VVLSLGSVEMRYDWLFIVRLLVPIVPILLVAWILLRWKKKKFAALIVLLSVLFAISATAEFWFDQVYGGEFYPRWIEGFRWPAALLASVVATMVAILVTSRYFSRYWSRHNDTPDYSDPVVLQGAMSQILDSEHFLTVLRNSLPRGEQDQEFGLDYIPYMLDSIDQRRKRASKSARLFLLSTGSLL
jgi:hypothetical protein